MKLRVLASAACWLDSSTLVFYCYVPSKDGVLKSFCLKPAGSVCILHSVEAESLTARCLKLLQLNSLWFPQLLLMIGRVIALCTA